MRHGDLLIRVTRPPGLDPVSLARRLVPAGGMLKKIFIILELHSLLSCVLESLRYFDHSAVFAALTMAQHRDDA